MNQVELMPGVWQWSGQTLTEAEWQARRTRMRNELEARKAGEWDGHHTRRSEMDMELPGSLSLPLPARTL